jgi:hypothetical protein
VVLVAIKFGSTHLQARAVVVDAGEEHAVKGRVLKFASRAG